jgi:hypothetical protein
MIRLSDKLHKLGEQWDAFAAKENEVDCDGSGERRLRLHVGPPTAAIWSQLAMTEGQSAATVGQPVAPQDHPAAIEGSPAATEAKTTAIEGHRAATRDQPLEGPSNLCFTLSEGPDENFKKGCELLATKCGLLLDPPRPQGLGPREHWYYSLWLDARQSGSRYLFGDMFIRFCEASAAYCKKLEEKARETEAPDATRAELRRLVKRRHRESMDEMEPIYRIIREMHSHASQLEMCQRLNGMPRPPGVAWHRQDWAEAYHSKKYKNSVCKWLSKHSRS